MRKSLSIGIFAISLSICGLAQAEVQIKGIDKDDAMMMEKGYAPPVAGKGVDKDDAMMQ